MLKVHTSPDFGIKTHNPLLFWWYHSPASLLLKACTFYDALTDKQTNV